MPNWVSNSVTIYGTIEEIKQLKEWMGDIDFNRIIPMPKEIEGFTSPVHIVSQKEFEEQEKQYRKHLETPEKDRESFRRNMTKELSNQFIKKYGYNNWHDWSVNNWGVKWSASRVEADWADSFVVFNFDTAWSPPELIYKAIIKKFPELKITWYYKEEEIGFEEELVSGEYKEVGMNEKKENGIILIGDIIGDIDGLVRGKVLGEGSLKWGRKGLPAYKVEILSGREKGKISFIIKTDAKKLSD
jgi:hypothetical protein